MLVRNLSPFFTDCQNAKPPEFCAATWQVEVRKQATFVARPVQNGRVLHTSMKHPRSLEILKRDGPTTYESRLEKPKSKTL